MVYLDTPAIPVIAMVESEMMGSMIMTLIAATGMDALTYRIEGYITRPVWKMTDKAVEIMTKLL